MRDTAEGCGSPNTRLNRRCASSRVQRVAEQQDAVLDPGVTQRLAGGGVERGFVIEVETDDLGAERGEGDGR